jgi:hypothetical protein
MNAGGLELADSWVPHSCTLPTVEQPLRVAEFDELFATAVLAQERPEPTRVRFSLDPTPDVAATAAGLLMRETGCCSFFTFTMTATAGGLDLDVSVAPPHTDVLAALTDRAASARTHP